MEHLKEKLVLSQSYPRSTADVGLACHFVGEVLGRSFRLMAHIRSEPHGEVYTTEDLSGVKIYEAKAYILRGIHPSQGKHPVENLKR
jgi:hypothetical protein